MLIYPSPHSQNITELQTIFKQLDPFVPGYHIDIMDGVNVPQKMGSTFLTNALNELTVHPLWVHLMVTNPQDYIRELEVKNGSIVSFHAEKLLDSERETCIELLEHKNIRPSIAVHPETSIATITPLCHEVDHILIMSVMPGKAGQQFLPETFAKLETLSLYLQAQELEVDTALDGGVTAELVPLLREYNVSMAAATSALFKAKNIKEKYKKLSSL